ncbi:nuclear transport factor 2 family protein [Winogradskyella sp. 3972H.M.0a.05]|uniref:nuclear transport factor 2 family protein n=1 Tax=Winogradskyella sp. 3972H.M.0a.05 TaxID=2950277 RepID=UPI003390943F
MYRIFTYLAFLIASTVSSQSSMSPQQIEVKKTIETFFDGFHKGDTTMMKSVMIDKVVMQTAFINKEGEGVLKDDGGPDNLLNAIANRPADQKWDERLTDFSIQVDANMANAWVDYEFWYNDQFSHCGVNSFQLVKTEGKWRIIYLIDSRRRSTCDKG